MEYNVELDQVDWFLSFCVGQSCSAMHYDRRVVSLSELGKVECLNVLRMAGWQPGACGPYKDGGERRFHEGNIFHSTLYWHCLMTVDTFFSKGITEVPHDRPHHFYKCLLELKPIAVQELLAHPQCHRFKGHHVLEVLRGTPVSDLDPAVALAV